MSTNRPNRPSSWLWNLREPCSTFVSSSTPHYATVLYFLTSNLRCHLDTEECHHSNCCSFQMNLAKQIQHSVFCPSVLLILVQNKSPPTYLLTPGTCEHTCPVQAEVQLCAGEVQYSAVQYCTVQCCTGLWGSSMHQAPDVRWTSNPPSA